MTYAEIVLEALVHWKGTEKEFADKVKSSQNYISALLREGPTKRPTSWKVADAAMETMGKTLEDCLTFPGEESREERNAIDKLRFVVRHDQEGWASLKGNIDTYHSMAKIRSRKKSRAPTKKAAGE